MSGRMLIVHLLVDTRDAMGANAVNTMAELVSGKIEEITGGRVHLRILSNLATHRLAKVKRHSLLKSYLTMAPEKMGPRLSAASSKHIISQWQIHIEPLLTIKES